MAGGHAIADPVADARVEPAVFSHGRPKCLDNRTIGNRRVQHQLPHQDHDRMENLDIGPIVLDAGRQ